MMDGDTFGTVYTVAIWLGIAATIVLVLRDLAREERLLITAEIPRSEELVRNFAGSAAATATVMATADILIATEVVR